MKKDTDSKGFLKKERKTMDKDLFDLFQEYDYGRVKWENDELVPTDDMVDHEDISDWEEYEIPLEEEYENY